MNVSRAFGEYQTCVNADQEQVDEARRRRDLFKDAYLLEPDVLEVIASGSLARGTHKDPIHDVDLIIVFDWSMHPEWGSEGDSAEQALDHIRDRVRALLGTNGSFAAGEVRLANPRNHAVKCFLDDPEDDNAFTVDVVPAFRDNGMLLVPEKQNRTWVHTDPEHLIEQVKNKHANWNKYAGSVRMLKAWAKDQASSVKIKSLVMEVLALGYLPDSEQQQSYAIKAFFVSAAAHVESWRPITDPAGVCGDIQNDLDYEAFAECLRHAADHAGLAATAQTNGDQVKAIAHWREVFGTDFPTPPAGTSTSPVVAPLAPRPVKDTPQG